MRISDWSSDVCSSDLQDQADRDRRDSIDAGIAGGVAQPDPGSGDDETGERGAVFEQHDEPGGVLRAPPRLPPAELAAPRVEFAHGYGPRGALEQEGDRGQDRKSVV